MHRRAAIPAIPEIPLPQVDEYQPRILSIGDQDRGLAAIPEPERGIFLALAHLGLRPGEARALDVPDYRDGWLTVDKAAKGSSANAPIRGTKTRRPKRLPVGEELMEWIERHVDPRTRRSKTPLFLNPRTSARWSHWALRDRWIRAGEAAGIEGARLYEGTKHTMATDAVRRGVSERALQTFLGHSDARSTRRYARMSEEALISVLRPRTRSENADEELSLGLSLAENGVFQPLAPPRKFGVPNGIRTAAEEAQAPEIKEIVAVRPCPALVPPPLSAPAGFRVSAA